MKLFEDQVDQAIEGLFKTVAQDYGLTSGDIDPGDSFALDVIKERLNGILAAYVLGNKIDQLKTVKP